MSNTDLQEAAQPAGQGMAAAASDSAKAVAEIQSAMTIAKRFPRDEVSANNKIKNAFQRTSLAKISQYTYAKGGTNIEGPSIRSAEAIAQLWGNIQFGFRELSRGVDMEGVPYSEIEAYAWDIESNTKRPVVFIVKHWRDTKQGGYALKDEREIYELTANMAQRRVRACIMAVIPGDVFDAAMVQAKATLVASADTSEEGRRTILGNFLKDFGVSKEQIQRKIQRDMEAIQPAQVVQLQSILASLRDGMSVSSDHFEPDDSTPAEVADKLPAYPEDRFNKNFDAWEALIRSGKRSAEDIIATLSAVGVLSRDQKEQLRAFHPARDADDQQRKIADLAGMELNDNDKAPADHNEWLADFESDGGDNQ